MGTLLAFTTVAISVLILRYIPPDVVPLPPSLQEPIEYSWSHSETNEKDTEANGATSGNKKPLLVKEDVTIDYPFNCKYLAVENCEYIFFPFCLLTSL